MSFPAGPFVNAPLHHPPYLHDLSIISNLRPLFSQFKKIVIKVHPFKAVSLQVLLYRTLVSVPVFFTSPPWESPTLRFLRIIESRGSLFSSSLAPHFRGPPQPRPFHRSGFPPLPLPPPTFLAISIPFKAYDASLYRYSASFRLFGPALVPLFFPPRLNCPRIISFFLLPRRSVTFSVQKNSPPFSVSPSIFPPFPHFFP